MLAEKNKHPRDERIKFFDEGHIYNVDGETDYTSVTTFIHHYFKTFDAQKVLSKMTKSRQKSDSPYFGKTDQEILDAWKESGTSSAASGTMMHLQIELYYNQETPNTETIPREWEFFQAFDKQFNKKPYRTEWYIFDEDAKLAGSVDMIYEDGNGTDLIIVDWKRTKELKMSNRWEKGLPPISHLDDCNYKQYCLQLNTYKYILEKNYGKNIKGMFLVVLHPNNENFIQVEVPVMQEEIKLMLDDRTNPDNNKRRLLFLKRT